MKQTDCLCSTSYAKEWIESFPVGNGRIGVMDNGNPHNTVITLNDDTLWSGYNRNYHVDVERGVLDSIRRSLDSNNFTEAEKTLHDKLLFDWDDSYLPLGTLTITRDYGIDSVNNYKRILDMSKGVHEVSFNVDNIAYKRTSFVSCPDNVYVNSITATPKDTCEIRLTSLLSSETETDLKNRTIALNGKSPSYVAPIYHNTDNNVIYDDSKRSLDFSAFVKIVTDGKTEMIDNGFRIVDYSYIRTYYSSDTSFRVHRGLSERVRSVVTKAEKTDYVKLINTHMIDFSKYYNRVSLNLDFKNNDNIITTESLMKKFAIDDSYLEAIVNLFNLGRYLMISASRENTMPMNLQGIWTNEIRSPWCSNYTLNINTEMNYWGAETVNLSELHQPLIEFIRRLAVNGKETARRIYNMRGWVASHNSDLWARTTNVGGECEGTDSCVYGYYIGASGWLTLHLWEHYQFTQDIPFLSETAYPIMLDAARFYLDYLTEDSASGYLIPSPSTSPENCFIYKGKWHSVNKASTMDIAIIRTLFKNILAASDILSDNNPILKEIETALKQLLPYRTTKKGTLMEWYGDYKETDRHHRHMSHLFALHPSNDITPSKTPQLAEACRASLERRGNSGTGWSIAWKVNLRARLRDGDTAFELLKRQLSLVTATDKINMRKGGSYKNMLCAHPPFQIDGNFGAMSGIAEMLIQSHDNCIDLLPALPEKWANGSFKGLCARGGYIVSATWRDHKVTEFEILSNYRKDANVRIGDEYRVYSTNKLIKLN